jgi:hypothetical protein
MKRAPRTPKPREKVLRRKKAPSPIRPPRKELIPQAAILTGDEIRLVVANYYAEQELRKRADMQMRHLGEKTPSPILQETADLHSVWESYQQKVLGAYAAAHPVGHWMMEQVGIGPVIAAGFLAFFAAEEEIPPTVGHWWSFAGLNPDQKWEKGQKRPFNRALKQIAYHCGQCIKRACNHPDSYYGPLYQQKRATLEARNETGGFAEKAAVFIVKDPAVQKKIRASGKVPPFYLDRMASRWVAKLFISHVHALMYWAAKGSPPPKPFAIEHGGHGHMIKVPGTAAFPGFDEAYYGRQARRKAA